MFIYLYCILHCSFMLLMSNCLHKYTFLLNVYLLRLYISSVDMPVLLETVESGIWHLQTTSSSDQFSLWFVGIGDLVYWKTYFFIRYTYDLMVACLINFM
jgi:hypothetical protein